MGLILSQYSWQITLAIPSFLHSVLKLSLFLVTKITGLAPALMIGNNMGDTNKADWLEGQHRGKAK